MNLNVVSTLFLLSFGIFFLGKGIIPWAVRTMIDTSASSMFGGDSLTPKEKFAALVGLAFIASSAILFIVR